MYSFQYEIIQVFIVCLFTSKSGITKNKGVSSYVDHFIKIYQKYNNLLLINLKLQKIKTNYSTTNLLYFCSYIE